MGKVYDRLVLYTDGSHIKDPTGTGAGIYGYGINTDKFKSKKGYMLPGVPEAATAEGFELVTETTKPQNAPEGAIEMVSGVVPLVASSAQVGELMAFVTAIRHAPFKAKSYIIITDSNYLKQGFTLWIDGWANRGWVDSNGQPLKNLEIIKEIKKIKDEFRQNKTPIKFIKIKGHSGRWGNEMVDALAKKASAMSASDPALIGIPIWDEGSINEMIEEETMSLSFDLNEIQPISYTRYNYVFIGEDEITYEHDGKKFFSMMHGNHAKNKDDIELLGKMVPDTIFGLALSTKPWDNINLIAKTHNDLIWGAVPILKKYDPVIVVDSDMVKRKKFVDVCKGDLPIGEMELREGDNLWMWNDLTISRALRPPLLSYRAIEFRNELMGDLDECLKGSKAVYLNDITPMLFDDKGKPRKDFYRSVDKSLKFLVKIPNSDKKIVVVMARDIDMPDRATINRIYEPGGKFYIACFRRDKRLVRYALVYKGINAHGIWCGYYSNNRFLTDDEI